MDSGYPCGAVDDGEAQGFHADEPVGVSAFGGGRFGRGKIAVELKADGQIVGQNGQLLPGAVGGVMVSGNGVEREFTLELGKGLFLRPAASDEVPQWAGAEREVSGDRRILEMPIIGGEKIELVVAPALVSNSLAKDYDLQLQLPNFKLQLSFETGDLRLHRPPVGLRGDRSANPGPLAKGHLDGIKAAAAVEQFEDIFLEKRRHHAEFQYRRATTPRAKLIDQLAHVGHLIFKVVDVAGAVLKPQNLPGLGQMRQ